MNRRISLAAAVSTILASVAAGQHAAAQTPAASQEELEEIVVTGLRGSLQASMETKRDAIGVVDAINAEDIGKFPDSNLSESLQRITGISISRRDGEGALVTARGFGAEFNMVTLNGRTMPAADAYAGNAGISRAFNFANLASESISAVEVYKTSKADIATGGIGATVNIRTGRPLDGEPGFTANLGVKAVHDTTAVVGDDITPEVSGIFSFVSDRGTWGVSLSASNQRRDSSAASADVNDWRIQEWVPVGQPGAMELDPGATVTNAPAEGQLYGLPNNLVYHFSDRKRERTNAQLTVQFQPSDALRLTTDYTYAENDLEEHRGDQSLWFVRRASAVTFDTGEVVATPVMISEDVGQGKDTSYGQEIRHQTNTLESLGFNADWQITDNFGLNFDVHDSSMESLPEGFGGGGALSFVVAAPVTRTQTFFWNNGFPRFDFTVDDSVIPASGSNPAKVLGNNNGILDIPDLGSQPMRVFYQDQVTDITQARLDGSLDFENGRFQFGVETRAMEMRQRGSEAYFALGDWGIARPGEIPDELVQNFCVICEFDDFNTSGTASTGFKANPIPLAQWAAEAYGVNPVASTDYNQDNVVEEDTRAAYFQVHLGGELGGMEANVLLGARYETTDVTSTSNLLAPTQIRWLDNNDFFIDRATSVSPFAEEASYNHLLPSLDFDIELVENVKARFSYSKTIARAQYDQLRSAVNVNGPAGPTLSGIQATASASNPGLVPLESDNFDLSVEWYFDTHSYVAAGFFEKRVANFIGSETVAEQHFGLRDVTAGPRALAAQAAVLAHPAHAAGTSVNETELFVMAAILDNPQDFPGGVADYDGTNAQAVAIATAYDIEPNADDPLYEFLTQRPVNNKQARLHGFEVGGQHFFGESGFGLQANYTIVRGDVEFDNNADPDVNQFALPGLSDSANVVLMYENFGLSVRLAWNWRDEYLRNSNWGSFRNPDYVEAYEQYDLSVGYDVNDQLSLAFEGLNLTGEDIRQHGRSDKQMWYLEELGPRYALGARYKF
jgi:TonB-dependent receptor